MVSQERVDRSLADETATKDLGIEHLAIQFGCSLHAPNLSFHQHNYESFPEKLGDIQEELINTDLVARWLSGLRWWRGDGYQEGASTSFEVHGAILRNHRAAVQWVRRISTITLKYVEAGA